MGLLVQLTKAAVAAAAGVALHPHQRAALAAVVLLSLDTNFNRG
jgi:hypothetical protein